MHMDVQVPRSTGMCRSGDPESGTLIREQMLVRFQPELLSSRRSDGTWHTYLAQTQGFASSNLASGTNIVIAALGPGVESRNPLPVHDRDLIPA